MNRLDREELLQPRHVALWSLLAFQAGFLNAFGFLAAERFVSHVTGFGTQLGVALAAGDGAAFGGLVAVPVSFAAGAFASGLATTARTDRGLDARYDLVAGALAILVWGLAGAVALGALALGTAGEAGVVSGLAFACGLQNAAFAAMTGGGVRTTHLTGVLTDFGADLARTVSGELPARERWTVARTNALRAATFVAFAGGAVLAVLLDGPLGGASLAVPGLTAALAVPPVAATTAELRRRFPPRGEGLGAGR